MSGLFLVFPRVADHLSATLNVSCDVGEPQANRRLPYLFVWGALPIEEASPMALVDEELHVQVVAEAVPEVNALASKVVAALEDFVPVATGYACQPLRVTHTTAAQTDRQFTEPSTNLRPAWLTVNIRFRAQKEHT